MSTFKILICDDEPHILHVVSTKLRNAGFEIATAADGEEGFETAQSFQPNLVITDYQMPYLSGLELCTKLRNEPSTSTIPAIMLTARGFSLGPTELRETNIKKVLPKPFSPRELLATAQQVLGIPASTPTTV